MLRGKACGYSEGCSRFAHDWRLATRYGGGGSTSQSYAEFIVMASKDLCLAARIVYLTQVILPVMFDILILSSCADRLGGSLWNFSSGEGKILTKKYAGFGLLFYRGFGDSWVLVVSSSGENRIN